jgi:SAM-dependent methyltransferase
MCSEKQIIRRAEELLKEVGIKKGQTVLDCCCGSGIYTTAAAQLVGEKGLVYAVDTNSEKLKDLRRTVKSRKLKNVKIMEENVELKIPLPNSSIDIVLLYDIFWYFRPKENKLSRLLQEVYKVAKSTALISVYPAHLDLHELKHFKDEIENKGFSLEKEYSKQLIHEGRIEKGRLLNFKKTNNRVKKLEMRIADLKNRLPAHSASPSMIEELEELEEKLVDAKMKRT